MNESRKKDGWDKVGIVLQPVGGFLAALSVASVGFLGSRFLSDRQAAEGDIRIYTEMMGKREEADSTLRKDMFKSIIDTFLKPSTGSLDQDILNIELLAYNFHESLDLGPLFKQVARKLEQEGSDNPANADFRDRLERVAKEVTSKQVGVLAEAGEIKNPDVDLEEVASHPEGVRVLDEVLSLGADQSGESEPSARRFQVEVLDARPERRELRVRLSVSAPLPNDDARPAVDVVFWLGFFDFPMIDNTRLSHAQRCAVVLNRLEEGVAQLSVAYFPASRASLKERPFYDEIIDNILYRKRERRG